MGFIRALWGYGVVVVVCSVVVGRTEVVCSVVGGTVNGGGA